MDQVLLLICATTRFACAGFIVIAAMTIAEAWNLINETTYTKEGSIVWVPLETCKPLSITLDSSSIFGNATFTFPDLDAVADNCHTFRYFINASVASMFFASVAMLLFIIFDMMARYCAGPISRSTVIGMSLFLSFLLIQTAACTYAIYKECQYLVSFYEEQFTALESSGIDEVRTYANKVFFFLTSIVAVVCAGLLIIDSILGFCGDATAKQNNKKSNDEEYVAPTATAAAESNDTIDYDVAANNNPEQPSYEPYPKSWTNY